MTADDPPLLCRLNVAHLWRWEYPSEGKKYARCAKCHKIKDNWVGSNWTESWQRWAENAVDRELVPHFSRRRRLAEEIAFRANMDAAHGTSETVDPITQRAAALTVTDPALLSYLRAVAACLVVGVVVGIGAALFVLSGGPSKGSTNAPSPGVWILVLIGLGGVVGLLVGLGEFRPYRYMFDGDYLTRVRYATNMTAVRHINEIHWANWPIRGVRITSSTLACTVTVREATRPLLLALGESLTRLNLLDKVHSTEPDHEVALRRALGLGRDVPGRSPTHTHGPANGIQDSSPSLPTPQDRPPDPPAGSTGRL